MDVTTLVEPAPIETERQAWPTGTRIAFRFCFVYFGLYCLLTQIILGVFPIPKVDVADSSSLAPIRAVIFWVGAHVFRLSTPLVYTDSGSGDKYYDWVMMFCVLIFAMAATAVWSILDRRRREYAFLQKWFWLFLCFCLGGQMLVYGSVKAVPLQMPSPRLARLLEPFGNFSPMGVLWSSIGASPGYERFAGCAELLGGLLLMFPRTVMLGALVCVADLTQIFMLNMTYDVPVKQLSFHLVLIAVLILAPDFKRLMNFFLLRRPAAAAQFTPLFAGRGAQRIASASIAFLWLWIVGNNAYGAWDGWRQFGGGAPKSGLYGIWDIEDYSLDGKPQPLLVTEAEEWRRMIFDFPDNMRVQRMDNSTAAYGAKIDQNTHTLTLTDDDNKNWKATFTFTRAAADRLALDGSINAQKATLQLRLVDHTKFPLNTRGFHWIQDYPFNR